MLAGIGAYFCHGGGESGLAGRGCRLRPVRGFWVGLACAAGAGLLGWGWPVRLVRRGAPARGFQAVVWAVCGGGEDWVNAEVLL